MSNHSNSGNTNLIVSFVVLVAIIVTVTLIGAYVMKPDPEIIEGEVEVDEMRVSSKLASRVSKICVEEGENVKTGDTLVILDSPELEAKLQQALAVQAAASAVSRKAQNGAREEQIRGAYETLQKAKAAEDVMAKSYTRVKNLNEKGVLPDQKLDEAEAKYKAAKADVQAAQSQYDMAKNGARIEDKQAASDQVNQAKGAVAEVKSYLKERILFAPIDGKISDIFPLRGELIGQGAPIMNLQDMSTLYVTFNVREKDYQKMAEGKEIMAFIPALGNKEIKLRITRAKDMGSYAAWKATKTRGEYDSKTFEIKAKPEEKVEGLIPGMTVIVK